MTKRERYSDMGITDLRQLDAEVVRICEHESECERMRDACQWESPEYWFWHDRCQYWYNLAIQLMP